MNSKGKGMQNKHLRQLAESLNAGFQTTPGLSENSEENDYMGILKESLIEFDKATTHKGPVEDLLGFSGEGELNTHKGVKGLVDILERRYREEDDILSEASDSEETLPVGEGPGKDKDSGTNHDPDEKNLGDLATKTADGQSASGSGKSTIGVDKPNAGSGGTGILPNPSAPDAQKNNIMGQDDSTSASKETTLKFEASDLLQEEEKLPDLATGENEPASADAMSGIAPELGEEQDETDFEDHGEEARGKMKESVFEGLDEMSEDLDEPSFSEEEEVAAEETPEEEAPEEIVGTGEEIASEETPEDVVGAEEEVASEETPEEAAGGEDEVDEELLTDEEEPDALECMESEEEEAETEDKEDASDEESSEETQSDEESSEDTIEELELESDEDPALQKTMAESKEKTAAEKKKEEAKEKAEEKKEEAKEIAEEKKEEAKEKAAEKKEDKVKKESKDQKKSNSKSLTANIESLLEEEEEPTKETDLNKTEDQVVLPKPEATIGDDNASDQEGSVGDVTPKSFNQGGASEGQEATAGAEDLDLSSEPEASSDTTEDEMTPGEEDPLEIPAATSGETEIETESGEEGEAEPAPNRPGDAVGKIGTSVTEEADDAAKITNEEGPIKSETKFEQAVNARKQVEDSIVERLIREMEGFSDSDDLSKESLEEVDENDSQES